MYMGGQQPPSAVPGEQKLTRRQQLGIDPIPPQAGPTENLFDPNMMMAQNMPPPGGAANDQFFQ